jgi:hypothetical protein
LVSILSFMYDPSTTRERQIDMNKKGKGTGDPGAGIHAVFFLLISYPGSHSNSFGIQPSPAVLMWKPGGQMRPTKMH